MDYMATRKVTEVVGPSKRCLAIETVLFAIGSRKPFNRRDG
jgi:hypothetical protein